MTIHTRSMHLIFASRPSALARYQTRWVMQALQMLHSDLTCEEVIITTQGDQILDKPLPEIGGKGLFTQELEVELLSGAVHCAVHSLKDLPIESPDGLAIGCIPERVDARDVLISAKHHTLGELPPHALVGTSSLRRAAQLLSARPDFIIQSLRGNVDTRVKKALDNQFDAILIAGAGVTRLGLESHIAEWQPVEVIMPAPGQGALAVQCREDDQNTHELLAGLDHTATRLSVTAERQFLLGLGGGCSAPVAAYATTDPSSRTIHMTGRILSTDGRQVVDVADTGMHAEKLGKQMAERALGQGAGKILSLAGAG